MAEGENAGIKCVGKDMPFLDFDRKTVKIKLPLDEFLFVQAAASCCYFIPRFLFISSNFAQNLDFFWGTGSFPPRSPLTLVI